MKNHGGQPCTICVHPRRKDIEQAILGNQTLRAVAKQFGPSYTAVWRHKHHLAPVLVKASNAAKDAVREKLEADLDSLIGKTRRLLIAAQHRRNVGPQLQVIARMQSLLELKAKVCGKLDDGQHSELHVHVSAEKALMVAQTFVARHGKELPN